MYIPQSPASFEDTISGCECPHNQVLGDDDTCIDPSDCTCLHKGKLYDRDSVVYDDCSRWLVYYNHPYSVIVWL